jgi:hypothetical protein
MRALCESCAKPQPADWHAGDLCVHCGLAVREQVRCYWCTHWIPAGKFCRHCGGEELPADQYAPARMLKFYGSDMFSIPKMLREMDPERVETFRSMYGKHLGVAMRHVEELRALETELFHKHWSTELEETLIPQLPWPDDKLEMYSPPENAGRNSPFYVTAALTLIVAIRHGEFELLQRNGNSLISSGNRELQLEAALQFGNWRVAGNTYLEHLLYAARDVLRAVNEKNLQVVLTQAYLGEQDVKAPEESLASNDPEIVFFGALLLKNEPILRRALSSANPLQRMVAADKLIRMNKPEAVEEVFRHSTPEQQLSLLDEISLAKKPVPGMHEALLQTIERHRGSKLAYAAADTICLQCSRPEAIRLAQLKDWRILHALSLSQLDPETYREIGEMLFRENMFDMGKMELGCFAKPGKMPMDFIEKTFPLAEKPKDQIQLLQFAEKQLDELEGRPQGTSMERVLIRAAFGDHTPKVIGAAWAGLHRINYRREFGSVSPFPYSKAAIKQFWPLREFEERLERLKANRLALKETFVADELNRFIRSRQEA